MQLRFVLTQHARDLDFFKYLEEYLGFGRTAINREGGRVHSYKIFGLN